MGTALPIIRGTSSALYPFTQTYICNTGKSDAQNGAATRWVKSPPIVRFELPYRPVTQADKNILRAAFVSAKGQFTTDLTLATDLTYSNLSLDADEFAAENFIAAQRGVKWVLTQTIPQNLGPAASGAAFPRLSNGTMGQLPWTQKKRFQSIISRVDAGPKYTYAEFAGGLNNFPNDGLMGWEFYEQELTDADAAIRIAHFLANWGDCFPFQFTDDDDASAYNGVYYASPQLSITRNQVNRNSMRFGLVQMNNGIYSGASAGGGGGGTPNGSIVSAILTYTTAHTSTGFLLYQLAQASVSSNGTSWTPLLNVGSGPNGGATWPTMTQTSDITATFRSGYLINFFLDTINAGAYNGIGQFLIYDCHVDVTYSDGTTATLKPQRAVVIGPSNSTNYVSNAGAAIDSSSSSYALIYSDETGLNGPRLYPPYLQLQF